MPGKVTKTVSLQGLSSQQIPLLQKQYGKNIFYSGSRNRLLTIIRDVFREPMFILLCIACSLYFILGNVSEGIMMAVAIVLVSTISIYQEVKTSRALEALKQLVMPTVKVIRDGKEQIIHNEDLVPGDIMLLEEGMSIPADAIIVQSNDLSVNEAVITGESLPVEKETSENRNILYQGTTIESGQCVAQVTATGNRTALGKIGKAIETHTSGETLLQMQINKFVRRLALFGLIAFAIIFFVNYLHYHVFAASLLFALTLAMSAIPEEIPVAFSSFMALGAYKMSKLGIISRQPQTIENLGATTVLCVDKTGTITENKMQLQLLYDYRQDTLRTVNSELNAENRNVLVYGILASETNPFDSMEKAIWEAYRLYTDDKAHEKWKMVYEYPLEGRPPMMTHVYSSGDTTIAACKGAAERIMTVCKLDEPERKKVNLYVQQLAAKGYRILGVASTTHHSATFPTSQDEFNWTFEGLLALYDPPRQQIPTVLKDIYKAKINVKLLTGDHPGTAMNIAQQVGITDANHYRTGEEIMAMTDTELRMVVKSTAVFARMFPDAKLKVIHALKENGEIVAMIGDGVNDGPALKAADIGIAMGKKGTEIAKQAADLVLTDDNLEKIVVAVSHGRKIFSNLIKAVRYIIAIHIPTILTASIPAILGWTYPNIFTPIHVIFLELIMGPTCSIFYENEPVEKEIMLSPPRSRSAGLFTFRELSTAIVQGLIITLGVLMLYYLFMSSKHSIEETRTIVFNTLILSNIFLTFADRSFTKTIYYTSLYKNWLASVIIIVSILFLLLLHTVPVVRNLFELAPITLHEFFLCLEVAFVSVGWFEIYKAFIRNYDVLHNSH